MQWRGSLPCWTPFGTGKSYTALPRFPSDPGERSRHFKAAGYYFDASMAGVSRLMPEHHLDRPRRNPMIDGIREELEAGQPSTYAAGVDAIYADILASARQTPEPIDDHAYALVFLVEHTRSPEPDEPGTEWFRGTQTERATLLTANTAVVIANYIRMLGYKARAHTLTTTEVDLNRLAVSAGLCSLVEDRLENAFVGSRFEVAAVTTTLGTGPRFARFRQFEQICNDEPRPFLVDWTRFGKAGRNGDTVSQSGIPAGASSI